MKRFFILMTVLLLATAAGAQPQGRGAQDPAMVAREQTARLDRLVRLTPGQYDRIYRFHERQVRNLQHRQHRNPGQMRDDMARLQKRTDRKYRRVLTRAQYERWNSFEAERTFRRVVENLR